MYDSFLQLDDDGKLLRPNGPDPAIFHRGSAARLLKMHRRHVAEAATMHGFEGLRQLGPFLLRRIADARTLHDAADHLRRHGGRSPGVNGRRWDDLGRQESWAMCRTLAAAIGDGSYRPDVDRKVRIPKEGRPDAFRELTVQCIEDRAVGRAATLILGEILERTFSPFSFGFRPRRGIQEALATALALAQLRGCWVWVSDDVACAFDHIPLNRFLDACGRLFPQDVVDFIRVLVDTGKRRGLRQGSPASPLFANLFFDHFLDHPWRRDHPDHPLIRYADDLLLIYQSPEEALAAYRALAKMAQSAGTPLKGNEVYSVRRLNEGQSLDWLGFRLQRVDESTMIKIAPKAWDHLAWRLAKAHLSPASPIRAVQIILGWISAIGPAYHDEDRDAVLRQIRSLAAAEAFEELPGRDELLGRWSAAHARWHRLFQDQAKHLPSRLYLHTEPSGGLA